MQTALSYALGSPARTTIKYYGPPYGLHSLSLCSYGFIAPIHACVLFIVGSNGRLRTSGTRDLFRDFFHTPPRGYSPDYHTSSALD